MDPKPIPGRTPRKASALKEWLPDHLTTNPDLTLEEHREAFEEGSEVRVSAATVSRAIAALPGGGWPPKKVEGSPRARRGGENFLARSFAALPDRLLSALASRFDARRLVFVDESGFHTSMTRLRSRAPKRERA